MAVPNDPPSAPANSNEEWLTGPHNTPIYTLTYTPSGPPKGVLLFVHGFVEHVHRYTHVFRAWSERGFAVFAYDQRGFGRTALDTAHASKQWGYGKTNTALQVEDVKWAWEVVSSKWAGVPVFLMGHSMGGGVVLKYCTSTKDLNLAGVLVSSPLLHQTKPAPRMLRAVGAFAGKLLPYKTFPAEVKPEEVSRDPVVQKEYASDKWIRFHGTLKGIGDMLTTGEELVHSGYKTWPETLPLLLMHGTADKVTSYNASESFYNGVVADDKKFSLYDGGFHELHNEPDGMKERMIEECVGWAETHLEEGSATARVERPGARL